MSLPRVEDDRVDGLPARRHSAPSRVSPAGCGTRTYASRPPAGIIPSRACRQLAERPEARADLGREQFGLFPRGEVAAPVDLVEVGEGGVGLLDPAVRGPEDLAGEDGEADRDRDLRRSLSGRAGCGLPVLPVLPGGRGPGAGQPVQRDVVEMLSRVRWPEGWPSRKAREIL